MIDFDTVEAIIKDIDISVFGSRFKLYLDRNSKEQLRLETTVNDVRSSATEPAKLILKTSIAIPKELSEIDVVPFVHWSIQQAVLHELDEQFKFMNVRPYDPHAADRSAFDICVPSIKSMRRIIFSGLAKWERRHDEKKS